MSVDVMSGATPQYGAERPLLALRGADDFAVSRDGQRFLVALPVDEGRDYARVVTQSRPPSADLRSRQSAYAVATSRLALANVSSRP